MQWNAWNITIGNYYFCRTEKYVALCTFCRKITMIWPETVSHIWHFIVTLFETSDQFWNFHLGNWPREVKFLVKESVWMKKLFQDPDLHLSRWKSLKAFYSFLWVITEANATSYIITSLVWDLRPIQINGECMVTSMGWKFYTEEKKCICKYKGTYMEKNKKVCLYTRLLPTQLHLQKE